MLWDIQGLLSVAWHSLRLRCTTLALCKLSPSWTPLPSCRPCGLMAQQCGEVAKVHLVLVWKRAGPPRLGALWCEDEQAGAAQQYSPAFCGTGACLRLHCVLHGQPSPQPGGFLWRTPVTQHSCLWKLLFNPSDFKICRRQNMLICFWVCCLMQCVLRILQGRKSRTAFSGNRL